VIRVELPVLVFIYLIVFLAAIFSIWIVYEWFRQRREKEALRYRVRCTICASIFEDKTNSLLPQCPRCGSLNERYKMGGF
jgi:DNA-directed RNA polymerase subunit RPC12/RpoP